MANFLIVSCLAESIGLAIRLQAEGHRVLYYIHEKSARDCGDGFVEKIDDWREHIEESDIILFDDCDQKVGDDTAYKSSAWSQEVREKYPGKLVVGGGSPDVARLENDRLFGQEVLRQIGVNTVPMYRFTSFEEGKKFIEENGGAWALKNNAQVDRDANAVLNSPKEAIEFMDFLEKNWGDLGRGQKVDYVLQQKAKDGGVEIAVTCFWDGTRFRKEFCLINQEKKKLLDGDEGPNTGQMGEIDLILPGCRLYEETLAKLEPWMADKGYIGFIDLNCIVTGPEPKDIVPLEFTARPGYPTFYSWCECLNEPVGSWLIRMAQQDPTPIQTKQGYNCTLVLATGTFPDQHPTRNKMAIIHGLDKVGLRHVWLCECRYDEKEDKVMGAGELGYLLVVTHTGSSIQEAALNAYKIIEQIDVIPFRKLRWDIGVSALKDFPKLAEWGWLS